MNTLILNGVQIIKREDGKINATQLCKAGGKKWSNFSRLDQTKTFIGELTNQEVGSHLSTPPNKESLRNFKYGANHEVGEDHPQPPNKEIIEEVNTGPNEFRGTWVCKELAVKLAAWISPAFEVQVMKWAWSMVNGEVEKIVPEVVQRADALNNTTSEVLINTADNEIRLKELEIQKEKLELEKRKFENEVRMAWVSVWREMQPSERDLIRIKDLISDWIGCPRQKQDKEITISSRAFELGLRPNHGQLTQIGRRIAKLYREKYGENARISKRTQWVDGAPREVNVYTEKDIDLIDKAILK